MAMLFKEVLLLQFFPLRMTMLVIFRDSGGRVKGIDVWGHFCEHTGFMVPEGVFGDEFNHLSGRYDTEAK
jgi:hypothetical protein